MSLRTCLLSSVQLLILVLNTVVNAKAAEEFTLLKADTSPIPDGSSRKCEPICHEVLAKGLGMYKEISTTTIPVYYIGDVAPFRLCRMYGANTIQLESYNCTTDGNDLFNNDWRFSWTNLSVVCFASISKSPTKMVSILSQSDTSKSDTCGTKIPFDNLPYNKAECPLAGGVEDQQQSEDEEAPVSMTASFGQLEVTGRTRTDKNQKISYLYDGKVSIKGGSSLSFAGVQNGYKASVECLKLGANKETVVRRLLKGYFGSVYPCVMGVDSTYSVFKSLVRLVWSCVDLPPMWELILSHPPVMNKYI